LQEQLILERPAPQFPAVPVASGSTGRLQWWAILLIVWVIGGVYEGRYLKRGWVAHDEGAFAESADRVLQGQLPHRDYVEIYTGGLAYLHALSFRYLGENFASPRIVLFVFFLAWIPAFYWMASRLVSDWVAGGLTLLAVAWSLPNYSAAVPSWYNLFFATFGLAALVRYVEKRSAKWLFIAGLCGGLSILVKIVGLYYVAAVLLFFLFAEQDEAVVTKVGQPENRSFVYTSFLVLSTLLFVSGVAGLIWPRASVAGVLDFVIPTAVLAIVVLSREARRLRHTNSQRFKTLLRICLPFCLGVLIPLLIFLAPYIRGNAVHAFVNGLFVLPYKRVQGVYLGLPGIETTLPTLGMIGILALGAQLRGKARWLLTFVAAVSAVYCLVSSAHNVRIYRVPWHAAFWLIPFLAATGGVLLRRAGLDRGSLADSASQQRLFLILAIVSLGALVQYPFAAQIYFCYVAPLVILGAAAVLRMFPATPRPLLGILFATFFVFAVFRLTPAFVYSMGFYYEPDAQTQKFDLPRAGDLRVDSRSVDTYKRLIPLIQQHAGTGEIYAAPDCPQVYFLAGYKDPTPAVFHVFEEDYGTGEHVLKLIDSRHIRVVVLNTSPDFSPPVPGELHAALEERFPNQERIGNFEVRWRN
jgi:Dolichyl-phosphate-mannose-protein mannosyltransferase